MNTHDSNLLPGEAHARQRTLIVRIVRYAFTILVMTFSTLTLLRIRDTNPGPVQDMMADNLWVLGLSFIAVFGAAVALDLLTPRKKISTITGVILGALAGMLAALAIGLVMDLLLQTWVESDAALKDLKPLISSIKVLLGMTFSYLGVTTVLQTQDEFRLVIPYVEFVKQLRGTRPILLDTSVLIDGRIVDIAATGIMQGPVVVPRFVIGELQQLADSGDAMKRGKGRRGLEVIAKLQRLPRLDVTIDETALPGKAVDSMLVELAIMMSAMIATTDLALARVASIQAVLVLNIHDLANAVKSSLLPGEPVTLKLIRQGEQATQAVGYLPDGTMVVAEDGASHIGETVTMTVTSSLQTSAGRLIFARVGDETPSGVITAPAEPQALPVVDTVNSQPEAEQATEPEPARTPFPPKARPVRPGTPRNPRR